MNQLLYGCQRPHCGTATCYTFRKTLSRNTNASRKLTVLSARIIACHLATQDDPFKALCPGKPVVPVMSSNSEEKELKGGTSRDSSFKEEILDDDEAEKENKEVTTVAAEPKEKKRHREGEVETVTDKGLKDPKSFPQQLFNTMSLKMVEWIGLPPLAGALKFSPESSSMAISSPSKVSDFSGTSGNREMESTPPPPHEQPPKYKFHSNPMELIDTGRLHRDSEPVSQHKHQEILQQPPAQKRRASNPAPKTLKDVVTPTSHSNAAKAKMSTPGGWGMPLPPAPPPIGGHHNHHKPRQFVPQAPQITPSRGERHTQISPQTAANEACVMPPQSLAKLDADICEALVGMCLSDSATAANKRDVTIFAKQSLFYVFSTPEALLKSFIPRGVNPQEMDLDMDLTDRSLRALMIDQEWENMIMRSLWMGLETVFRPGERLVDREVARLILLALHVLAATLPRSTPEQWEATRKLRGSGRVNESGVISEIGFENEMAERLMRRVARAIAYRSTCGDEVVSWLKGYFSKCGRIQEEQRRRVTALELGEELAEGVDRGRGGWGLGVCTLEWCRAVLLRVWSGQEAVKRGGVVASCLVLMGILRKL